MYIIWIDLNVTREVYSSAMGGQTAERLGNRVINQKVAGLIPGSVK